MLHYPLLILRTHCLFAGRVWLVYDPACCKHAAATNHTDWSTINVQLFNFHGAGASVCSGCELSYESTEPHGVLSSLIICKFWNRGHCIAPSLSCCFTHKTKCSSCFGPHHIGACPVKAPSQAHPSCKPSVDASPPCSSSKSRH